LAESVQLLELESAPVLQQVALAVQEPLPPPPPPLSQPELPQSLVLQELQ
jgi:hypothetical protein